MRRLRAIRRTGRVTAISILVAALLAGVGAWPFWTGGGPGTALATVATLDAPGNVATSATSGFTTVSVVWDPTTLSNGLAVDGYYVTRTEATSGAAHAACGTSPGALTTGTSCSDTNVPDGTYVYDVVAVFRTWTATGTSNAVTISADTTPPATTLAFPADGARYRAASWSTGCNVAPFDVTDAICGTAQDSGANSTGVAQVQISVRRDATLAYWDGSSFASSSEVRLTAGGTTAWTRSFPAANFTADGTYTVRAYGSDGTGNTTTVSASVLIDNTAPALVTVIAASTGTGPVGFLRQGGGYRVYANASDAGSGLDLTSLSADVSAITTGGTGVGLSSSGCPCLVGGTSYAYRSNLLTADNPLGEGAKPYSLHAADNVGNTTSQAGSASVDNTAPSLTAVIAAGTGTGPVGFLRQGGSYRVYANASDGGSGLDAASLSVDVSAITGGATAVALSSSGCPCVVGGTSYAYRSAVLTADSPLGEGAKAYSFHAADNVGNTASQAGSASVDNTPPSLSTVIAAGTGTNPVGFLHQGGGYVVYANASDGGSGLDVTSLTADVSAITSGATGVALSSSGCPCLIGGTSYAYRSPALTADNPLGEGAKAYSVHAADNVGNSGSQGGSATVDNTAPALTTVIAASTGTGPVGFLRQGGGYFVYANASDAGSGVDGSSITADVSSITTGATSISLSTSGGPWTIAGASYAYRSTALTADNPLAEGAKPYSLHAADNVGNAASQTGSATVDNTPPAVTTVIAASTGTGPVGYLRQGGGYRVYANASDAGSGLDLTSLSADVSAITTGATGVGLSSSGCPCLVGGTSYAYRSNLLTADNPLGEGAKPYSLHAADNVGNTTSQAGSASVDNTAPTLSSVIADSATNAAGFIHLGGTYFVYLNADDTGSGLDGSSLNANVNSITTGATAITFSTSGGPWTIDGTSYSYRSAQQRATPLAAGSVAYTVIGADNVGNSASPSFSVTVDNTAPAPSNTTLANGGTAGTVNAGDTVTIVYSERIASNTFCSTWTNNTVSQTLNASDVVVTITNNLSNDVVTVSGGVACAFHLGLVGTFGNYVSSTATFAGSGAAGTGANSTIAWNPGTRTITITLGKQQTGSLNTGVAARVPSYAADGALRDLAGNSISTLPVNGTSSRF